MNIIIDTNILFAALLRNSTTRRLLKNPPAPLLAPRVVHKEIAAHQEEILSRSRLEEREFRELLNSLLNHISIIDEVRFDEFIPLANSLLDDTDDSHFLACGLAIPGSIIWSNDAHLKQQSRVRIVTTSELVRMLYHNADK